MRRPPFAEIRLDDGRIASHRGRVARGAHDAVIERLALYECQQLPVSSICFLRRHPSMTDLRLVGCFTSRPIEQFVIDSMRPGADCFDEANFGNIREFRFRHEWK